MKLFIVSIICALFWLIGFAMGAFLTRPSHLEMDKLRQVTINKEQAIEELHKQNKILEEKNQILENQKNNLKEQNKEIQEKLDIKSKELLDAYRQNIIQNLGG
jgi:cell division protein FtsB